MSISCKGSKINEQTVRKNKKIIHEETHFTINKSFRNIDKKKRAHEWTLCLTLFALEPLVGFEPTTPRLQITCSGQLS